MGCKLILKVLKVLCNHCFVTKLPKEKIVSELD